MSNFSDDVTNLVQNQVRRLRTQLDDLEENKNLLDEKEYDEMKRSTLDQLHEFETSLKRANLVNINLTNEITVQRVSELSIIRDSKNTEAAKSTLLSKESEAIRLKIKNLTEALRYKRISTDSYRDQVIQLLDSLTKSGATLTKEEKSLYTQVMWHIFAVSVC